MISSNLSGTDRSHFERSQSSRSVASLLPTPTHQPKTTPNSTSSTHFNLHLANQGSKHFGLKQEELSFITIKYQMSVKAVDFLNPPERKTPFFPGAGPVDQVSLTASEGPMNSSICSMDSRGCIDSLDANLDFKFGEYFAINHKNQDQSIRLYSSNLYSPAEEQSPRTLGKRILDPDLTPTGKPESHRNHREDARLNSSLLSSETRRSCGAESRKSRNCLSEAERQTKIINTIIDSEDLVSTIFRPKQPPIPGTKSLYVYEQQPKIQEGKKQDAHVLKESQVSNN